MDAESGGPSRLVIVESADGLRWEENDVPAVISELYAGTVIDDRLWFVARVHGFNEDEDSWQLVSTQTGAEWDTLGPMMGAGVGPFEFAPFLGRAGDRWIMASARSVDDPDGIGQQVAIWTSTDGVTWEPAEVLGATGDGWYDGWYAGLSTLDGTVIVSGTEVRDDVARSFVMHSRNGKTWSESAFPGGLGVEIHWVSCGPSACLAAGALATQTAYEARLWRTLDGKAWSLIVVDANQGIGPPLVTPSGYVAAGEPGLVWTSTDGFAWNPVEVGAPHRAEPLYQLAINGDVVLGLAYREEAAPSIWLGSLERLGS